MLAVFGLSQSKIWPKLAILLLFFHYELLFVWNVIDIELYDIKCLVNKSKKSCVFGNHRDKFAKNGGRLIPEHSQWK